MTLAFCLEATDYIDFDHPDVQAFAVRCAAGAKSPVDIAKRSFVEVRDRIRYDPYTFCTDPSTLKASYALASGRSYCIPKAILLAAVARYHGIPARLGFADVKNHLATRRLLDWLRSDLFSMHGYVELFLEQRWVKATPTFDQVLCRYFRVPVLEFDGVNDSVLQATTLDGKEYMHYVEDHGTFDDMPFEFFMHKISTHYPHLVADEQKAAGDFIAEAISDLERVV